MSLNLDGFREPIVGAIITLPIANYHSLVKLENSLLWEEMLQLILPDLKETNRLQWWGRATFKSTSPFRYLLVTKAI